MTEYRWNLVENAEGYEQAGAVLHPYYLELQNEILARLALLTEDISLVVDLGGGSGRLMERVLSQHPSARGIVIDQSPPFLALAEKRLEPFGDRGVCVESRLQDDWTESLPASPTVFVSTSAIHHLDAGEKQQLYQRCFDHLAPGGVLLNGDEVRDESDDAFLQHLHDWWRRMEELMASDDFPKGMHPILHTWRERNIENFATPKVSGDDCQESLLTQLNYFNSAGFNRVEAPWRKAMWALMEGVKAG